MGDDGIVPLICPTCQNVLAGKASMPATTCYFAWGCFRYFGWERSAAPSSPSSLSVRSSYAGHHASPFRPRGAAPRVARRRAKHGGPGKTRPATRPKGCGPSRFWKDWAQVPDSGTVRHNDGTYMKREWLKSRADAMGWLEFIWEMTSASHAVSMAFLVPRLSFPRHVLGLCGVGTNRAAGEPGLVRHSLPTARVGARRL